MSDTHTSLGRADELTSLVQQAATSATHLDRIVQEAWQADSVLEPAFNQAMRMRSREVLNTLAMLRDRILARQPDKPR